MAAAKRARLPSTALARDTFAHGATRARAPFFAAMMSSSFLSAGFRRMVSCGESCPSSTKSTAIDDGGFSGSGVADGKGSTTTSAGPARSSLAGEKAENDTIFLSLPSSLTTKSLATRPSTTRSRLSVTTKSTRTISVRVENTGAFGRS